MSRVNKKDMVKYVWECEEYLGSTGLSPALQELIKINTLKSKSSKTLILHDTSDYKDNSNLYFNSIDSTPETSMFI